MTPNEELFRTAMQAFSRGYAGEPGTIRSRQAGKTAAGVQAVLDLLVGVALPFPKEPSDAMEWAFHNGVPPNARHNFLNKYRAMRAAALQEFSTPAGLPLAAQPVEAVDEIRALLSEIARYAPAEGVLSAPTAMMGFGGRAKHLLASLAHPLTADHYVDSCSMVERHQALCAAVYQAAGVYHLPVRFLDALFDAANGEIELRQKTGDLLPCDDPAVERPDAVAGEPPLAGRWHHGNGYLACGSFRIARADWEAGVCEAENLRERVFDWICLRLNGQPHARVGDPDDIAEDAARWRFVRELAWFIDEANRVYRERYGEASPDWDEIQDEIDKVRLAAAIGDASAISVPPSVEETICALCLISDTEHLTDEIIAAWTDEQRTAAVEWALAVHYRASDNDDVDFPERPEFTIAAAPDVQS